jgi:hypothetical protein
MEFAPVRDSPFTIPHGCGSRGIAARIHLIVGAIGVGDYILRCHGHLTFEDNTMYYVATVSHTMDDIPIRLFVGAGWTLARIEKLVNRMSRKAILAESYKSAAIIGLDATSPINVKVNVFDDNGRLFESVIVRDFD